jgi:putative protease
MKRPGNAPGRDAGAPAPREVVAAVAVRLGRVVHSFPRAGAALVAVEDGELRVGDVLHFRGHTTDFCQRVERLELEGGPAQRAGAGQRAGVAVSRRVREHDLVFRLESPNGTP